MLDSYLRIMHYRHNLYWWLIIDFQEQTPRNKLIYFDKNLNVLYKNVGHLIHASLCKETKEFSEWCVTILCDFLPSIHKCLLWDFLNMSHNESVWCWCRFANETLHWCHNEPDGVSNHQPHHCLLNCLFRCRSKKTSKLRVTGLCAENSLGTGEFPAQKASNAENVSIWWRHHEIDDVSAL